MGAHQSHQYAFRAYEISLLRALSLSMSKKGPPTSLCMYRVGVGTVLPRRTPGGADDWRSASRLGDGKETWLLPGSAWWKG